MTKCDEALRLLEQLANDLTLDAPRLPSIYTERLEGLRAFLAQPTAAREAVLEQLADELAEAAREARTEAGAAGEVDVWERRHLQGQAVAFGFAESRLRRALADTSPAAAALLARGEENKKLERTLARAQRIIGKLHIEKGELIQRLADLAPGEECICGLPEPAPTQHGFHCPKAESPSRD